MSEIALEPPPSVGMDFSIKVTAETGPDQRDGRSESQADVASSPVYKPFNFKVEQPEGSHPCPACPLVLPSSRELTTHLRGHNSPRGSTDSGEEADYACGVCRKVLSSASSLDRHVLVHSGERPFKCKHCEMAFTTNGNMNRHLRTAHCSGSPGQHSCTDSDGSSDSERPRTTGSNHIHEEYNNNEVATERKSPALKRKCPDYADETDGQQRRHKIFLGAYAELDARYSSSYSCAFCGRGDFSSGGQLEAHIERQHPESEPRCEPCNQEFKNHRSFNLHRYVNHCSEAESPRSLRNSVVGFNDLTFVDFSAVKFPAIARAACERALHRPASGETPRYQCSKCLRAFPCRSALDAHEMDCGLLPPAEQRGHGPEDQSLRNDFFAGLNLQDKAALAEAKEGKDLADIQSIISVTSGPILQSFSRSDAGTPDNCKLSRQGFGSSGSSGTPSSECLDEEGQEMFAAEFRKMKLKGEFPCRLCKAVFPNLRALKGHNRAHMGVPAGLPYPCNMCPYSSTDKATLVRHLRSHNGDRPYECSICNYAFTTKANCERHVRNRHGKLSREEIKSVLIYHPSEDSANDAAGLEAGSPRSGLARDEVRKALVYPPEREETSQPPHYPPAEIRVKDEAKLRQPGLASLGLAFPDYNKAELFPRPPEVAVVSYEQPKFHHEDDMDSRSSTGSVSLVSETKADALERVQTGPMDLKKPSEEVVEQPAHGEDAPLDLSMDVLDLSRKANAEAAAAAAASAAMAAAASAAVAAAEEREDDETYAAVDPSHKENNFYSPDNPILLTQALLKVGQAQPSVLESFYASARMLYQNFQGLSAVGAGIFQPYQFGSNIFGKNFVMKDRLQKGMVRGLQTSGGSLVEPAGSGASFAPAFPQTRNDQLDYLRQQGIAPGPSRDNHDSASSANSVKMVIKNGVLMPKQKQRRYRTERPFTCEHCNAKFTLRSNMERHIKQQHPQYWSQRPRGGHSTRGRPPANPPTLLQSLRQSPISHTYGGLLPRLGQDALQKHAISNQVKFAILAQKLKGNKTEENDTDEELVIDEEEAAAAAKEPTERTLSLLRGKLEANLESKAGESSGTLNHPEESANESIKREVEDAEEEPAIEVRDMQRETSSDRDDESLLKRHEAAVKEEAREAEGEDLASVSEILDNASQQYQQFQSQYMSDEEGLVASTSDCNQSGSDEKSDSVNSVNSGSSSISRRKRKKMKKVKKLMKKKKNKSAYSMAPNRVICPYCERPFPWTSSLRRHILTHTGQKPYRCEHCSLLFTTKSNCDRHLLRKHKAKANKVRRARSTSSPELQEAPASLVAPVPSSIPAVAAVSNGVSAAAAAAASQFSMRNVPERPYKCNQCPSSTFSTLGNLKKHRSQKHPRSCNSKSSPGSPSSEHQHSPQDCHNDSPQDSPRRDCPQDSPRRNSTGAAKNDQSDHESQSSGVSEHAIEQHQAEAARLAGANGAIDARCRRPSPRASPGPGNNNETPYKCHLCDSGFAERQDCLDHLKDNHERSYEMLVAKGALDMDIDMQDEPMPPVPPPSDSEDKRKTTDYSHRKVICAFCVRRFWSAEDLRRHMRTHTGERPFSCDICCRRFTLKHSMLRHRKKHESVDSSMYVGMSGEEEENGAVAAAAPMSQPATITPRSQQQPPPASTGRHQERASLPQVASVATADAAPSGLMRFNPYEKLTTLTGKLTAGMSAGLAVDANDNTDNDLISNLLGIRDKSFMDRVLQASADDAAKLLGVKGNHE